MTQYDTKTRLAMAVFALVENLPIEMDVGYADACALMGLTEEETAEVLEVIEMDFAGELELV